MGARRREVGERGTRGKNVRRIKQTRNKSANPLRYRIDNLGKSGIEKREKSKKKPSQAVAACPVG